MKRCLICKEIFHDSKATEVHSDELKALKIYLIFIDILLTGTDHGCQFSINVVTAHTLNISRILKFNISNSHNFVYNFFPQYISLAFNYCYLFY